jgi:acetylornithine deacetylase/succinyl-diaminopimelate desuccinylase-like protein
VPEEALSAIDGAHEVIRRLQALAWPDRHPLLGGRHAVVYEVRYAPVAPHPLPADAYLTVDRRLLPGDAPAAATAEIREAIGDLAPYRVAVMRGVTMLPALVDPAEPWVRAVQAANVAARGREAAAVYGRGPSTRAGSARAASRP